MGFIIAAAANASKCSANLFANAGDRSCTPTSMFRVCAASVKLADETKARSLSTTTHFACMLERSPGTVASDLGSK